MVDNDDYTIAYTGVSAHFAQEDQIQTIDLTEPQDENQTASLETMSNDNGAKIEEDDDTGDVNFQRVRFQYDGTLKASFILSGDAAGTCSPFDYNPVCATNGRTYDNYCLMRCDGASYADTGRCVHACNCNQIYKPVCGQNGKSYYNSCNAVCAGQVAWKEGACSSYYFQKQCNCSHSIELICGINGKLYGNECLLKCDGTEIDYKGSCFN